MVKFEELVRGDLISVDWVDIAEDPTSSADEASLARRHSIGFFWGQKLDGDIPVVVTTTTLDEEIEGQQGFCCYPQSCIVGVRVIKRKRRAKKAKKEGQQ